MRRLFIVRHAPVVVKPDVPSAAWQLTSDAASLVRNLASEIPISSPSRIISSKQDKALQTARILASEFSASVEVRGGFEEHHRGNEPFIADDLEFRTNIKSFFERPNELVYGNETAQEALTRFQCAVDELMSEGTNDEIVVTHGTVGSLYLATHGGDAFEIWSSLATPDYRYIQWTLD